ncbi:hypothetical protein [Propioniciclava tarda]|uniref:ATP/GTP-binding protein n=1 Tax=Propioniciclava tarda TaxID=433330 RepID=A0A4Q9KKZ5_PROTD|nr:hypothetical protein [Propioniciclava tarda]TBT95143.1 hypothetical protein ET996_06355 [Propioniciclava tarda]SMO51340.1 hypothetical protein SAMN06266982_10513 [Propioniciclava tarda]
MARRPSKHVRPARALASSFAGSQVKSDGDWVLQSIGAGRSEKAYLCPGCNQQIAAGASHVVVWPSVPAIGATSGLDDRKHWHRPCWDRRR